MTQKLDIEKLKQDCEGQTWPPNENVEKKRWASAISTCAGSYTATTIMYSSEDEARKGCEPFFVCWPARFDSDGFLVLPEGETK